MHSRIEEKAATKEERRTCTVVCSGYKVGVSITPCPRRSVIDRGVWIFDRRNIVERMNVQYDTCPACTIIQREAVVQSGGTWDDRMGKYGLVHDLLKDVEQFIGREPSERMLNLSTDLAVDPAIRLISQGILAGQFTSLSDPQLHHAARQEARRTSLKFLITTLASLCVTEEELTSIFEDPEVPVRAKQIAIILGVDMGEERYLGDIFDKLDNDERS